MPSPTRCHAPWSEGRLEPGDRGHAWVCIPAHGLWTTFQDRPSFRTPPEGVVVSLRRVVNRVHARFMHEGGVVVELSVTAWITTRRGEDDWSAQLEPLAQLAVTVAARLDAGDVTGPLVRELRSTLLELRRGEDGGDAFELLAAELSAAVRDSQD